MLNQKKTQQHSTSNVNKHMQSFFNAENAEDAEKSEVSDESNGKATIGDSSFGFAKRSDASNKKQKYKSQDEKKEKRSFGNKYQNRKHNNSSSNTTKNEKILKNKKDSKSSSIEYHFGETDNKSDAPYFSVEIPIEKIRSIFEMLKENFGENEIIKEYSMYKKNDLILTVYPDGSSFCSQLVTREIKDPNIPPGIFVLYNEKYKHSNDNFPCQYIYNSIVDVVDIIFSVNNDVKIVLSTIYENNRNITKVKNIESLGRPTKFAKSKNAWCELYMIVECNSKVEEVHDTIKMLHLFFPTVPTSQT